MGELVSVVVPAFNEADHLLDRLGRIVAYLEERFGSSYELVVVDDGSEDATAAIVAEAAQARPSIRLVRHERNAGLDAAVRTGIAHSAGSVVVLYDADLTYDPAIIGRLTAALREGGASIAVASAYMPGGSCVAVPRIRKTLSVSANRILSFATHGRLHTLTCMVRAYDAVFAREFFAMHRNVETTFDILLRALRAGISIVELPATLDWSRQPAERAGRLKLLRAATHASHIFGAALHARPSLWLAIPGLIPGLFPLCVAIAAMMHASAVALAEVALVTTIVQYTSLAFFTYKIGDHAFALWRKRCNFPTTRIVAAAVSEKPS